MALWRYIVPQDLYRSKVSIDYLQISPEIVASLNQEEVLLSTMVRKKM